MTETPDEEGVQMKIIWEAGQVQEIVDALGALVDEARFQFLHGLIRIWVIDPGKVGGVYIDLDPDETDWIQHYSVQEDGLVQGLNISRLDDLLSYADADIPIQFEFGSKHNWRFNITMPGVDVDQAGIDPESVREPPDHPGLEDELPPRYTIDGSDLNDAVTLNDMFSDHTTIIVDDHQVQFLAEGDSDSGTFTFDEADGEAEFLDHPDERVESMFSLAYFDDLRKVLKHYDEITVYSGDEMPVMLETDLFQFMLAPRLPRN